MRPTVSLLTNEFQITFEIFKSLGMPHSDTNQHGVERNKLLLYRNFCRVTTDFQDFKWRYFVLGNDKTCAYSVK